MTTLRGSLGDGHKNSRKITAMVDTYLTQKKWYPPNRKTILTDADRKFFAYAKRLCAYHSRMASKWLETRGGAENRKQRMFDQHTELQGVFQRFMQDFESTVRQFKSKDDV